MLRLIPAPLHRLAYRAASQLRAHWRRWAKPKLSGTRVIAFDDGGRIAFVRLSYGSAGWSLPGGGLGRREDPLSAGRREFREETGCELTDPAMLGVSEETSHGAPNRVHWIGGRAVGHAAGDQREVLEVGWFAPHALPDEMSARLRAALPAWITAAKAADPRPPELPPAPPPAPTG